MVYGRRRVGKTELVVHSLKKRPGIYFLAEEKNDRENLGDLQALMSDYLKDVEFGLIKYSDWVELFRGFSKRNAGRCIIVIDEFPYLVERNPAVPSKFQKIWDQNLQESGIVLVLIGSSISMMEKLLGSKSPLHGRRTGQMEVRSLPLWEVEKFLPGYSAEDAARVYGCVDGIPLYIKQFDGTKPFDENLKKCFLERDALLYEEAEILLKQEFRDPANYFSILKAIAHGNTKQGEITCYTRIEKSIISKYLQNLENTRLIRREYPVTERKEKKGKARFRFTDNYLRFWFRFVYPSRTAIEKGEGEKIAKTIKEAYSAYMGPVFEGLCEEFLWRDKPFEFLKSGRWWNKTEEIDLVALNPGTKEIGFFECKWKNLKEREAREIIHRLEEKAGEVDWNNGKRREFYGIIARSIEGKEDMKDKGRIAYDLEDFGKKRR